MWADERGSTVPSLCGADGRREEIEAATQVAEELNFTTARGRPSGQARRERGAHQALEAAAADVASGLRAAAGYVIVRGSWNVVEAAW